MNKTDFADYLTRTWPVLTTPEDVLDLGRQLQTSWELNWEDRDSLVRLRQAILANQFRVKSLKQWRILRDALRMVCQRIGELPVARRMGFWD